MRNDFDDAVIGGGLVGAAIAWGLARSGRRVAMLDEGDIAYRASRGNFALIWVQSKGLGMPAYAAWTRASSDAWGGFAAELEAASDVGVAHRRPGGFTLALSEAELEARVGFLARLHNQPGVAALGHEILDHRRAKAMLPGLGPEVVGAIYCPLDGDVNSLKLLRALHVAFRRAGGTYLPGASVERIEPRPSGGFRIARTGDEEIVEAAQVVLAAGNGNPRLATMLGLEARVRPQRGQILVTEKVAPFLPYPVVNLRQTDEGGVMIGDSLEEVGFDDRTVPGVGATMASRAIRAFPHLASLNVVRSWAALRVMSEDGFPIYDASSTAKGAYLITCHSGVTLAAAHALEIAPMIAAGALDPGLSAFSARRFHVPAA